MSATAATSEWRAAIAPYARAGVAQGVLGVATSVGAYLAILGAMHALLDVSPWLAALLVPLAAGFLVRTYIVFHDCAHGSFLPSGRGNVWLGSVLSLWSCSASGRSSSYFCSRVSYRSHRDQGSAGRC